MSKIAEVESRISPLLEDYALHDPKPLNWLVREWMYFAQQYIEAANVLDNTPADMDVAQFQVSGHAVECAFKAFLLVSGQKPGNSHDLLALGKAAESHGCYVTEMQAIAVFQLSRSYSRDIPSRTKYKARYPTANFEQRPSAVSSHDEVSDLVSSVISQVVPRLERLRDDA